MPDLSNRSILSRAQRVLDKLDCRLEAQTFHRHADRATSIVSLFASEAAAVERQLARLSTMGHDGDIEGACSRLVRAIMACRRIVAMHLQECRGSEVAS